MGIFDLKTPSLADGENVLIHAPVGTRGIVKVYITSTNLTHASVVTQKGVNTVLKAVDANYQGFFPLKQVATEVNVIVYTGAVAETITILTEWE